MLGRVLPLLLALVFRFTADKSNAHSGVITLTDATGQNLPAEGEPIGIEPRCRWQGLLECRENLHSLDRVDPQFGLDIEIEANHLRRITGPIADQLNQLGRELLAVDVNGGFVALDAGQRSFRLVLDADVDLSDADQVLFRWTANCDPGRDQVRNGHRIGFDATCFATSLHKSR